MDHGAPFSRGGYEKCSNVVCLANLVSLFFSIIPIELSPAPEHPLHPPIVAVPNCPQ